MLRLLGLTFILLIFWSCIPTANNNGVTCSSTTVYNPQTRSCDLPINLIVDPTLSSITLMEDSAPTYVKLEYSDVEGDYGTACTILSYTDGIDNFPPLSCSCSGGVCSTYVTPDLNFSGIAQFSYNIIDQDGTSLSKAVVVTVTEVNDNPQALPYSLTMVEGSQQIIELSSYASDVDSGQSLTYSLTSTLLHGTDSGFNPATGGFVYTASDYDTTHTNHVEFLQYQVCDNASPQLCDSAIVTITITSVNNAPEVADQSEDIVEGMNTFFTLDGVEDSENDPLTYTIITDAALGTLSCTDGNCSYDPDDPDFTGTDSFTYNVCDSYGDCSSIATVTLNIKEENDPPTPGTTADITVNEDDPTTFTLAPAYDPEEGGTDSSYQKLTYHIKNDPVYGSLSGCVLKGAAGGECTYTPNPNYDGSYGDDSFTYEVFDGEEYSNPETVNLIFVADNDAPVFSALTDQIQTVYNRQKFAIASEWTAYTPVFTVGEGGGIYEYGQSLTLTATSSHPNIVDPADITFYYDTDENYDPLDDSSVNDTGLAGPGPVVLGDGANAANLYNIYLRITSGSSTGTATVTISAIDSDGASESMSFHVYVPQIDAIHGGWKHISAIGKKTDKYDNSVTTGNSVRLEWHSLRSFTGVDDAAGDTVSGWNIFRREFGGSYDFTEPLNKSEGILPSTQYYYDDTTVDPNQVYFYTIRPVDQIYQFSIPTDGASAEVRVISPPVNMAFVHRWMVNQEVCLKMGQSMTDGAIETDNNYRCEYVGPGSTDDSGTYYYDIGYDMLVDLAEAGCPYSEPVVAPECGLNGCIGIVTPQTAGITPSATNLVYYDRSTGVCWRSNGTAASTDWEEFRSVVAYDSTVADDTAKVLLPPLSNMTQQNALDLCESRAVLLNTISGATITSSSTLPNRKEQLAYSAWNDLNTGYEDDEIADLEEGLEIDNYSKCNSSGASGLSHAYTSVPMPASPFGYSVPGTDGSLIRSIYTGSESLSNDALSPDCISRYGIQDVYGNVAEWVQDRVVCSGFICTATTTIGNDSPMFDSNDIEMGTYAFNGVSGPCDEPGSCADYMTSWRYDDDSYNNQSAYFLFPLALPVTNDFATDEGDSETQPYLLRIGSTQGITDNQLHDDEIIINAEIIEKQATANDYAGMATGGSYLSYKAAGRYTVEFIPETTVTATISTGEEPPFDPYRDDIGFRCIIRVESDSGSSDYGTDPGHSYSY